MHRGAELRGLTAYQIAECSKIGVDSSNNRFKKTLNQKCWKSFECDGSKMRTPSLPITPIFFIAESFSTLKTRAQCVKIWLIYEGLKFVKNIFNFFYFSSCERKNTIKQWVFQICSKTNFNMVNNYPLILYVDQHSY